MSTATSPDYTYTRPSSTSTRALLASNPPSAHESGTATPSDPISPHGTLHRRKTNNYETALADRLKESIASPADATTTHSGGTTGTEADKAGAVRGNTSAEPVVASGLAYRGDAAAAALASPTTTTTTGASPISPVSGTAAGQDGGRPLLGVLGRQQSFKQADQKRAQMEKMLAGGSGGGQEGGRERGYTTSAPGTPV